MRLELLALAVSAACFLVMLSVAAGTWVYELAAAPSRKRRAGWVRGSEDSNV